MQTTDTDLMKKIRRRRIEQTRRKILRSWQLYLFLVPALVYFIVFHYVPMFGVQIAFKDYRARAGIWGSKWVGLQHRPHLHPPRTDRLRRHSRCGGGCVDGG